MREDQKLEKDIKEGKRDNGQVDDDHFHKQPLTTDEEAWERK